MITKVAVITGGAKRIGKALSEAFHELGYNVAIQYLNSDHDANNLCDEFNKVRENSSLAIKADLNKLEDLQILSTQIINAWGKVDLLINNASNFEPLLFSEATEEQWDRVLDCNLKAPYFLSQFFAEQLKKSNGNIINMVDIYGERPLPEHSIYSISKAGLIMQTKSLAKELGPEVRVNGIAPGAILWPTNGNAAEQKDILDKTALKKTGNEADIVAAALYLAENAPYVTGQILAVDGGRSLNI